MINVEVKGVEAVKKKLEQIPRAMPAAMKDTVLYVHSKIPPYPPAPAASSYRRTGLLGKSVTTMGGAGQEALSRVEGSGGNVKGIVGTRVKYAPFVIDKILQARFHKAHGWYNLQDVIHNLREDILRVYREALIKYILR